jgi:hypothetical protein
MAADDELLALEHEAWEALTSDGSSQEFYETVLADRILVLMPGGLVIDDRERMLESMKGATWDSFELVDERVLPLTDDCAVVAYRATARRGTDDPYTALFNSTYVRERGQWRLAVHQQTPI